MRQPRYASSKARLICATYRLSHTRYSAKGTKGKWRQQSEIKMRHLPAVYSANGTKGKWRYASEIEMSHLPAVDRFKRYGLKDQREMEICKQQSEIE